MSIEFFIIIIIFIFFFWDLIIGISHNYKNSQKHLLSLFTPSEHEGEVTAVDVSADGFRVLAGTSVVSRGGCGILCRTLGVGVALCGGLWATY